MTPRRTGTHRSLSFEVDPAADDILAEVKLTLNNDFRGLYESAYRSMICGHLRHDESAETINTVIASVPAAIEPHNRLALLMNQNHGLNIPIIDPEQPQPAGKRLARQTTRRSVQDQNPAQPSVHQRPVRSRHQPQAQLGHEEIARKNPEIAVRRKLNPSELADLFSEFFWVWGDRNECWRTSSKA
ncbi:hypothetical protein BCR34DRAFT_600760 [Clohesyomyces aquaticus]|uniref:Uncharacterized protein n=1 Tax=Clohesyomyces aquaticus TaxID=1231657 RepID=A0A1Y1ZPR6_9PLEO|nr:hypothetical protein BCR34DRAFT_600760 [Clohesyomyces aquaticus]